MSSNGNQQNVRSKRDEDLCFALFVIAAFVGLYQFQFGPAGFSLGNEMVSIAKNLVEHGSYANPNALLNTGPTAANPPLYPLYLALLMKIFNLRHGFILLSL